MLDIAMADATLILGVAGVVGTIGGTVAGAAIASRTTSAIEDRRELREERDAAAGLQMAARLIRADLLVTATSLEWVIEHRRWDYAIVRIPLDGWEEHRALLARGIEDAIWEKAHRAFVGLVQVKLTVDTVVKDTGAFPDDGAVSDRLVDSLAKLRASVLAAHAALGTISGESGV